MDTKEYFRKIKIGEFSDLEKKLDAKGPALSPPETYDIEGAKADDIAKAREGERHLKDGLEAEDEFLKTGLDEQSMKEELGIARSKITLARLMKEREEKRRKAREKRSKNV